MPGDLLSEPSSSTTTLPRWLTRPNTAARVALLASAALLLFLLFGRPSAPSDPRSHLARLPPRPPTPRLRQLKGTPRSGMSGKMQRACGEMEEGITYWLNSFERMEESRASCADLEGGQQERERLMKAGSRQCGSWCIWDLDVPEHKGWFLEEERDGGGCFVRFSTPHQCDQWVGQRAALIEKLNLSV